jgi:hypothetical protein
MTETNPELSIEALTESAQIMFVTLNAVFELHKPKDGEGVVLCGYCSALAKSDIIYPCPTSSILLADMVVEDAISELFEPAESEEPSA